MDGKRTLGLITLVVMLMTSNAAFAFRSTDVESYTDPDYKGYQPKKVLLLVENASQEMRMEIEKRLTSELVKKGIEAVPSRKLFPPTREFSSDERGKILEAENVDSALVVTIGETSSQVMAIATQNRGTAQMNARPTSGGGYNATGNVNSTSQNIYSAKSKAEFSAVLFDVPENRAAWSADVQVKAKGTLFVSEKGDAKGLVGAVIKRLEEDGHLVK